METLAERLADSTRVNLHPSFVEKLRTIASNESVSVDLVWNKWKEYSNRCRDFDQSPVLFEFCQCNEWKVIQ